MSLANQKHLFEIPDDVVWLNSASQSPCLHASAEAGRRAVSRKAQPWDPERQKIDGEIEDCRDLLAGLIGASGDDIALTLTTSFGLAQAAANLPLAPGQDVVVLAEQFPSNYYVWKRLAQRSQAQLRIVPRPDDFDWTSAVMDAIGPACGLVALPNCHWTDGSLIDLEQVGGLCRDRGIPLVVDATQSMGACPTDVGRISADFIVVSAYKWLLCPDCTGFAYVAPHRQQGQPVELNHRPRAGAPPMTQRIGYSDRFDAGARRFDMGASNSMIHIPMIRAALEQITGWGVDEVAGTLRPLVDEIAERATEAGYTVPPARFRIGHFIGLRGSGPPPPDLDRRLAARGVHISLRGGAIRVSPYLFNDARDVESLFAALRAEAA